PPTPTLTVEPESPLFTGESVTLKCEIQSDSDWRYQWYKGSSRTAVSQTQTHTFTIRSAADQDQYWCRGERDNRPTSSQNSRTVTLTVKDLPTATLTVEPESPVFTGESVTLKCEIQSDSDWTYQWYKGSSRTAVYQSQTYTFTIRSAADQDQYWCRGDRDIRPTLSQNSSTVTLTVKDLPTATLTVKPKSPLFTGESVTLKCEIQSDSNWRYQWYKGSSGTAVSQSQKHTFTIRSAADQDQYWCRGERDNRPTSSQNSSTVTLTVEERPTPVVSVQPGEQVFRGETVTLSCVIQEGGVSNWEYSWSKGGSSTPVSKEQQYSISSVTQFHSGTYTCRGTVGKTSRSSHTSDAVTLSVSDLPRATLTVEPEGPLFTGESVTLRCEIQSESNWRYQWYKGSSGTAVSQSQTHTFTIRSAADQDQYWCRGDRDIRPTLSQNSRTVTLTVKERPTPVVSVQPGEQVFRGETVTLSCVIQEGGVSNWEYSWSKGGSSTPVSKEQQYSISSVTQFHSGTYTCRGTVGKTSRSSHTSDAVTLSVSALAV
ncbi:hypothetical protein NFI96_006574, partial [Prochilodus magdalenae]